MESWQDGSRYEGGYKEGMKHGHGKYIWNDGSMYEGQWCENKINGVGIYIWPDGRKYSGEWKDNNMHGKGVYRWTDGMAPHAYIHPHQTWAAAHHPGAGVVCASGYIKGISIIKFFEYF